MKLKDQMKIDDRLSDVFDIEAVEVKTGDIITADNQVVPQGSNKIESDYDRTRNNLHSLLQLGQDALFHALEIAKSTEHPRAFEVVGNLMKQLSDVNSQLLDLHDKKRRLDVPTKAEEVSNKQITNNAIFVGSTSELNKFLENMNKENT
jgi:hypothetical protein